MTWGAIRRPFCVLLQQSRIKYLIVAARALQGRKKLRLIPVRTEKDKIMNKDYPAAPG